MDILYLLQDGFRRYSTINELVAQINKYFPPNTLKDFGRRYFIATQIESDTSKTKAAVVNLRNRKIRKSDSLQDLIEVIEETGSRVIIICSDIANITALHALIGQRTSWGEMAKYPNTAHYRAFTYEPKPHPAPGGLNHK